MREYYRKNERAHLLNRFGKIRSRCLDPDDKEYHCYGGRGIVICQQWIENPDSFVEWAKQSGFERRLQIDRKQNDGPYSPENCQWVTSQENNRNRTNNKLDVQKVAEIRKLLSEGSTQSSVARKFGVHHSLIGRIKSGNQWV